MRACRTVRSWGNGPTGLLCLLLLTGCVSYHPEPLDPAARPAEYRARRLDDPRLREYLQHRMGSVPQDQWSDAQLAFAALLFRPELERDRANLRAAEAAVVAAGARPAIGVQGDVERAVSQEASPWVVSLAGLFTLELGGKRGARQLRARAALALAQSRLGETAWNIVQQVRLASAAAQQAEEATNQLSGELAALEQVRDLERQRYAEAALTSSELARTGAELQAARAALASAQRRHIAARADLARAIGVPPRNIQTLSPRSPMPAGCGLVASAGQDSLEHLALTSRPEISIALAEYAEAEAGLRVEISRQYPDLQLGPGFIWDQGVNRWMLGLALPALLGRNSRAPIRAAEAQRATVAQQFFEAQESVLGQLGAAVEACRGARLERSAADSELVGSERGAALTRAAYGRGETGRTEVARSELTLQRARRTLRESQAGEVLAGLQLEAAAGEWVSQPRVEWPDPRETPQVWGAKP
jgi:outer membrane protein, heavy metal efflux system